MRVDLKVLDNKQRLNRTVQDAAIKQFQKLERYLPDAAHIDLRLELITSQRKGKTHYAHVAVAIPREPRTFHAEATETDFRTALDRIYGKAEKHLRRRHDKLDRLKRDSERKGTVNDWLSQTLSAPKRLLGKFRKQ